MLDLKCDKCGKDIKVPAALVFSPPKGKRVIKYHICFDCWFYLEQFISTKVS